jgi:hypothetical protein
MLEGFFSRVQMPYNICHLGEGKLLHRRETRGHPLAPREDYLITCIL